MGARPLQGAPGRAGEAVYRESRKRFRASLSRGWKGKQTRAGLDARPSPRRRSALGATRTADGGGAASAPGPPASRTELPGETGMCPRGSPACETQKGAGDQEVWAQPLTESTGWPLLGLNGGAAALQSHLLRSHWARSRGQRSPCARAQHRPHSAGRGRIRIETAGEEWTSTAGGGAKPQNRL